MDLETVNSILLVVAFLYVDWVIVEQILKPLVVAAVRAVLAWFNQPA